MGGTVPNNSGNLWLAVRITFGKVVLFIGLMLVAGVRFFPWLLSQVEKTGSRELFTLAVVALALGVAFGSAKLFGVSFALGAFFAGVVVNESDLSHRAARELQPLQDAFTVLFFVAVGMLFDPDPTTVSRFGRACNCRNWKVARRFRDCSSAGRLNAHGTHCLSCAGSDR
jgi:CPA2 family monovalent cation:H+ antiporter-2